MAAGLKIKVVLHYYCHQLVRRRKSKTRASVITQVEQDLKLRELSARYGCFSRDTFSLKLK
jgi:hypothetical protein